MKNLLLVLFAALLLFSCKKEEDITDKDYTVTAKVRVWDASEQSANENIQGAKFRFYNKQSDPAPFATLYTGPAGWCSIVLKGDTEYYVICSLGGYDDKAYSFHSTKQKAPHEYISNDVSVIFVKP